MRPDYRQELLGTLAREFGEVGHRGAGGVAAVGGPAVELIVVQVCGLDVALTVRGGLPEATLMFRVVAAAFVLVLARFSADPAALLDPEPFFLRALMAVRRP